jgi:hypothetical protein
MHSPLREAYLKHIERIDASRRRFNATIKQITAKISARKLKELKKQIKDEK